jgi:hypothetical protein
VELCVYHARSKMNPGKAGDGSRLTRCLWCLHFLSWVCIVLSNKMLAGGHTAGTPQSAEPLFFRTSCARHAPVAGAACDAF